MAKIFATYNPLDKGPSIILSSGNLVITNSTPSIWNCVRSTIGKNSGKWYWETTMVSGSNSNMVGIGLSSARLTTYLGIDTNGWSYYSVSGQKIHSNTFTNYGLSYVIGDVIGVALDMDIGTIECFKNNISQGIMYTGLTGTQYAIASLAGTITTVQRVNFGASAFIYTPPVGFNAGLFELVGVSNSGKFIFF